MKTNEVINHLKEVYNGDRFQFDFNCAMHISGDSKKQLRQDIVLQITGEKRPITKCGLHAVANELKNSFDQLQLF